MRGELLGAASGGVWTAADARAAGISGDSAARACSSGRWQVLRRGVYLDGGVEPGVDHRAWAAVLSAGGLQQGVACGRTAARLHGLPLVDDDDPANGRHEQVLDDVAVRRGLHGRESLRVHRWAFAPGELGTLRGCPVPSLLRTLWDLRLVLREDALVCALDHALHAGQVTREQLVEQAAGGSGARRAALFRGAVGRSDGRSESPLETLTRLVLQPLLPDLEPQIELFDAGMRVLARVDLGVRALRLAVEADGGTHRGAVSLAADRERERRTGWAFERTTWREVRCQPAQLRARVLARATALDGRPLRG